MALKFKFKSKDEIPAELVALYAEREGAWQLDVDGVADKAKLDQMIKDAGPLFKAGEKMQLQYNIRNTHRAIGTKVSSKITRQFGMSGLQPGHLTVRLRGSNTSRSQSLTGCRTVSSS